MANKLYKEDQNMRLRPAAIAFYILQLLAAVIITSAIFLPAKPPSKNDVVALAKNYLGVPYRYGGSTPAGFDCSGYIMFLFQQCGTHLPRTADKQVTVGVPVNVNNLQPGDLLFFSAPGQSDITHTGLYIGSQRFIHASATAKKVIISSLDEPYWQETLRAARQIK